MFDRINKLTTPGFRRLGLSLIIFFSFLLYGKSLQNGFVHDDIPQIVENPYIQHLRYLPHAFTSSIWGAKFGEGSGVAYCRPLHSLSYLLTYAVSSSASFFHLINIVYYILVCWLFFLMLGAILNNRRWILLTTLIFLFHPVHSEAVNWIACVPELLCSIFVFAGIYVYISKPKYYYVFVPILFFLGLLSKESTIFFLPFIVLYDYIFTGRQGFYALPSLALKQSRDMPWRVPTSYIKKLTPYGVTIIVYLLLRFNAVGFSVTMEGGSYDFRGLYFLLNGSVLFRNYIGKFFYPFPLNHYIDFDPIITVNNIHFLTGIATVIAFSILYCWALLTRKKILTFSLTLFFFFLLPVVTFLNSLPPYLFNERYLLLPSAGLTILVGWCFLQLISSKNQLIRGLSLLIFLVLLFFSGRKIFLHTSIWKSHETLFRYTYLLLPEDNLTKCNWATFLIESGKKDEGLRLYQELLTSEPRWQEIYRVYNQMGVLKIQEEMHDSAHPFCTPRWPHPLLSELLKVQEERLDSALHYFEQALTLKSDYSSALINIGTIHYSKGDFISAMHYFNQAVSSAMRYFDRRALSSVPVKPTEKVDYINDAEKASQNYVRILNELDSMEDEKLIPILKKILLSPFIKKCTDEKLRVQEILYHDENVEVLLKVIPMDIGIAVIPQLIFYKIGEEVFPVPASGKKFIPQIQLISILLPKVKQVQSCRLFIPLSSMEFYEFIITRPDTERVGK